jgi:hypothetical protein
MEVGIAEQVGAQPSRQEPNDEATKCGEGGSDKSHLTSQNKIVFDCPRFEKKLPCL